jgi:small-conductance mechanosensitive channel
MTDTFWQQHGNEISAAITLAVAIIVAVALDRFLLRRATEMAERMGTEVISRSARTRLRLIRRLVFVAIIAIGVALALSQFASIKRLGAGILASTAVLGLVIGFAAQHVIGNAVAGVMLAITQPLRIGDLVTIDQTTGRVRDIGLAYTTIENDEGAVLFVPNGHLITNPVLRHAGGRPPPEPSAPEET